MLTASGRILDEIDATPPGYLYTIAIVSYFKRGLVTIEMPVAERLHFLETINGWVDAYFTEPALAAIEPACKTGAEMIQECLKVDRPNDWKKGAQSRSDGEPRGVWAPGGAQPVIARRAPIVPCPRERRGRRSTGESAARRKTAAARKSLTCAGLLAGLPVASGVTDD